MAERLIVEADGGQHAAAASEDAERSRALRGAGYRILRFWINDVLGNLDGVLTIIAASLAASAGIPPDPLPREREGPGPAGG